MDARPSGWYDDPNDDDLLRYWDGVVWTEHTALKRPQTPPPGHAGMPSGIQDAPRGGYADGAGQAGHGYGSPGWAAPGGAMADSRTASGAWRGMGRIAADGRPYSGWFRRVIAFLLDALVVGIISTPLAMPTFSGVQSTWEAWLISLSNAISSGADASAWPAMPEPVVGAMATAALITTLVTVVYEVFLLSKYGATLGMLALGIRVRQVGRSGPANWLIILRRTVIKYVSNFFNGVPVLGPLSTGFVIASYLWPIWDTNRQALHDKFASTEVVRVRAGEKNW
ncbi:MAG: RDD family protein [Dermatophilus congolensis]|nr:RDD family protein [Dermatophilus congolensis]